MNLVLGNPSLSRVIRWDNNPIKQLIVGIKQVLPIVAGSLQLATVRLSVRCNSELQVFRTIFTNHDFPSLVAHYG